MSAWVGTKLHNFVDLILATLVRQQTFAVNLVLRLAQVASSFARGGGLTLRMEKGATGDSGDSLPVSIKSNEIGKAARNTLSAGPARASPKPSR